MSTSKPEAGQCYPQLNDVAREFLLYDMDEEADYKGDADGVTLRLSHASFEGYRNAMRLLRKYLETNKPTPPANQPDPDEWVVQDRVPIRVNDRGWWVSSESRLPEPTLMWVASPQSPSVDERRRHGEEYHGAKLHVMCRRRDLPPEQQSEPDHVADASKKVSDEALELIVHLRDQMEALSKRVAECERLPKKPEPQPAKTRVRLWTTPEGRPYFAPFQASKHDDEICVDAEGFYVLEASH